MPVRSARSTATATAVLLPLLTWPVWGQSPASGAPLGELFATVPGAPAVAQPAGTGMSVASGSELAAGVAPATLKLARGGQVRLFPENHLTPNRAGPGLMLGMGTGAVEIDYRVLQAAGDVLITPDFNVRLAGPNTYHFALGVSSRGDTCFKPLPGNTAGVLFSEVMGTDSFGTSSNEAMVFSGGKIAGRAALKEECGCPVTTPPPVLRAEVEAAPNPRPNVNAPEPAPSHDPTPPVPSSRPGENPVVVGTPFVFSAEARPPGVARLQLSSLPNTFFAQDEPDPAVLQEKRADVSAPENSQKPAAPAKKEKQQSKGFMARLKGFFGSLFHR